MPYFLDGNNLIGRVRGGPATGEDRAALVAEIADRLRRTRASAVLFFDGSGDGGATSLGPLTVRYAGRASADDAIVSELRRAKAPADVVVVTADRDLASRARDAGARALDPDAFWTRFGNAASPGAEPGRVDVADWLRYFEDESNRR